MEHINYAFWAMSGIAGLAIAGFWTMTHLFKRASSRAATYLTEAKAERQRADYWFEQAQIEQDQRLQAEAKLEALRAKYHAPRGAGGRFAKRRAA